MKFHTVHFSHTNLTVKLSFYFFYQLFPVWSHDEDVMKPKGNCGRSESGFTKMHFVLVITGFLTYIIWFCFSSRVSLKSVCASCSYFMLPGCCDALQCWTGRC